MNPRTPILAGMKEATALTRAGRLTEATAQIQQVLRGAGKLTNAPNKRLGQTLRAIARGGMPEIDLPSSLAVDARLAKRSYSGPEGSREYMLFIPSVPMAGPMPVVVMLHGCTQSPEDFAAGTRMNTLAEALAHIVIYPAQPRGANANKCWNWFRPGDQSRGQGEPAILAGILREVLAGHPADPKRVYVAGLSAGGAAAAILAQEYPDLIAAVGVHSGLAAGSASDVGSAFGAMRNGAAGRIPSQRVPTIVFHGTADTTVAPANAVAVARQGRDGTPTVTQGRSAGGRNWHRTTMSDKGRSEGEVWLIEDAGHAWSGGSAAGSFTDPSGPDASAEMLRFFAQHQRA